MKPVIIKRVVVLSVVVSGGLLFRSPASESAPPKQARVSRDAEELASISFSMDSQWVMADAPWSLGFRLEPASDIGLDPNTFSAQSPVFDDEAISQLTPYLKLTSQVEELENGLLLHRLTRPNLIAQVLTRKQADAEQVLAVLVSRPDESGLWLTFELNPNPPNPKSLLELPPQCKVKATRFSKDGTTPQFQLLANTTLQALAYYLSSTEWKIEASDPSVAGFRCRKGNRIFEFTFVNHQSVLLRVCSNPS